MKYIIPERFKRYSWLVCILFATLFFVPSCSTKKATFLNVNYHNTTTHYNVWWNGNQSLIEAEKLLKSKNKDDYTQILNVFQLGTKEDAISANPQLDRAIEKGSKGFKKHSINIKGKEHVAWVRDCYLLVAKAHFYKQDYDLCASTCRFIINQFKNTDESYEAMILYAHSMVQTKEYGIAESTLDQLRSAIQSNKAPSKLKKQLYPVYAQSAIAQKKYRNAVQYLTLAIEENNNRKLNTRLYFILGQINQDANKKNTATTYYKKVIRRGSSYEMEFNAKLNMAACFNVKSGNSKEIYSTLNKMLKDSKNEEYLDQIYYALGEVSMELKDATKACDYWKKSVAVSTINKAQKIKSALIVANTYYDLFEDYASAKKYYDTALLSMTETTSGYQATKSKQQILKPLVENIETVILLDSLLKVSELPIAEQEKIAEKAIAATKEREATAAENELVAMANQSVKESSNTLKGNWYFYNASTVQRGKESFVKLWGKRALTDNWRTGSKQIFTSFASQTEQNQEKANNDIGKNNIADSVKKAQTSPEKQVDLTKANDPYSKEYYLKNLFTTQAQKDSANIKVAQSLLIMGFIYYDGLKNEKKAIETFLKLAERYPHLSYVMPAYYQLYRIYDRKGDTPNANYYKNLILRGFPDSDYAYLIRDENYYQEMIKREKVAQKEYEAIYVGYQKGDYREVAQLSHAAIEAYRDPELNPKFMYMESMALGRLYGADTLIAGLEKVIAKYPQSEIIPLVKEQLALLKAGKVKLGGEKDHKTTENEENIDYSNGKEDSTTIKKDPNTVTSPKEVTDETLVYRYRDNIEHYVLVIVDENKINTTNMRYAISDFNMEYFANQNIKVKSFLFTQAKQVVTIQSFENAKKAMDYYSFLIRRDGPLKDFDAQYYKCVAISVQNYPTFYNQKNIEAYESFFKNNYLK